MKVKTWIRRYVCSDWIDDEKAKKLLLDNGIYNFFLYKEQIVKVDLNEGEWSVLVDGEKADSEVQYKIENSIVNVSARSACILIK